MSPPRFEFMPARLSGVFAVGRTKVEDERGFLSRLYCDEEFKAAGLGLPFVQVNLTLTHRRGAVRGMHFQKAPRAEIKFVNCLRGQVFDVAVDLRRGSATFLQWYGRILSAENQVGMIIPKGVAHGFQALSEECELLYLHTASYDPASQGAVSPTDARVSIAWPLEIVEMSERDRAHPPLAADFVGIDV